MNKQTVNQAINDKNEAIEELKQQRNNFAKQALECEEHADKLTESDGDIDGLANEISSLRTKAVILLKRKATTEGLISEANKQLESLHRDKANAIENGLKQVCNKALEDLNEQLAVLVPVFRRAQVALHYSGKYYSPGISQAVRELIKADIHGLVPLLKDTNNEKQRLYIEMRDSV